MSHAIIGLIVLGVYLVGAYLAAFISGYFDYEPDTGVIFWPVYVAAFLVIAALMPFVWAGMGLYSLGRSLRLTQGTKGSKQ